MIKAVFSASLLQSSVSHDSSEIILICWFAAPETFLIIISVENSCAAEYVSWCIFFKILESSEEQHLYEIEIFCNIIFTVTLFVFTVTFDQFNASLLNKNIDFFKKHLTDTFKR